MDAWNRAAWRLGFKDAFRRYFLRDGLVQARVESDIELERLVRSARAVHSAQAFDILQAISFGAPPLSPAMLRSWDHASARYWVRASRPYDKTFDCNEAKFVAAATICVAEFELPRSFAEETAYELILKMAEAANEQILGFWRGGQLGPISFIYEAATAHGVSLCGVLVRHDG